jgi:SAM-dependent methyltransferase/uncharacterized protein YbaR (Trm112 family)
VPLAAEVSLSSSLRCPFCGGALAPDAAARAAWRDGRLWSGVLACACCTYPVVDGIPCVRTGDDVSAALHWLRQGREPEARLALLGVDAARAASLGAELADDALTFRRALELLSPDAEGTYLLYRFSDPTFLASRALLGALAAAVAVDDARPVLDLCCGTGHLAWAVSRGAGGQGMVLADLAFWKVWLARRFMLPSAAAVCCDANDPLPFARDAFALAYVADAFHYVWHRRRCADELSRVVGAAGVVALAHVHNALAPNHSAGMPLEPAAYVALFERAPARAFRDADVLTAALDGRAVDLARDEPCDALADEPALHVVATRRTTLWRPLPPPADAADPRGAVLNPLYVPGDGVGDAGDTGDAGDGARRLRFPSDDYADEYAAARRYLPERVRVDGAQLARARAGAWDDGLRALAARRVLLDVPAGYL